MIVCQYNKLLQDSRCPEVVCDVPAEDMLMWLEPGETKVRAVPLCDEHYKMVSEGMKQEQEEELLEFLESIQEL